MRFFLTLTTKLRLSFFCFSCLLATLCYAWPPGVNPGGAANPGQAAGFAQQNLHDQLMQEILSQQNQQLAQLAKSAEASAVSSQGALELTAANFPNLYQQPALTTGSRWQPAKPASGGASLKPSEAGHYQGEVPLEFETHNLSIEGQASDSARLAEIDFVIEGWKIRLNSRAAAFDSATFSRLNGYYDYVREWLHGEFSPGISDAFVFVASAPDSSGKPVISAVAIGSLHPQDEVASLEYVVANPSSQMLRELRPANIVGRVGTPLMDYSYRQLGRIEGLQKIWVHASNNGVMSFAHSRGFKASCE